MVGAPEHLMNVGALAATFIHATLPVRFTPTVCDRYPEGGATIGV